MEKEVKMGLNKMKEEEEARIAEAFSLIDSDGTGTIDAVKLEMAIQHVGIDIERGQIEDLISKLDTENVGTINLDQFREMMTNKSMVLHQSEHQHEENRYQGAL